MVASLAAIEPMNFIVQRNLRVILRLLRSLGQTEHFADLHLTRRRPLAGGTRNFQNRRSTDRTSVQIPILVTAVNFDGQIVRCQTDSALRAVSRDLSLGGIGFIHDEPLAGDYAIVTFDLRDGNSASVLLEVRWSNRAQGSHYMSGGRFQGIVESVAN